MWIAIAAAACDPAMRCIGHEGQKLRFVPVHKVPFHECFHVSDIHKAGCEVGEKEGATGRERFEHAFDEVSCYLVSQVVADARVDEVEVPEDRSPPQQRPYRSLVCGD